MHLTDFLTPPLMVVSLIAILGLSALPFLIRASRAWENGMLSRWANENGAQIVKARRLLWMGGRRVSIGFRVTVQTREGVRRTGVLKIPWSEEGYIKGNFVPDGPPFDSNHVPDPSLSSVTPTAEQESRPR